MLLRTVARFSLLLGAAAIRLPGIPLVEVEITSTAYSDDESEGVVKAPPYNTTYYFDQLIDHNDPSRGTFQQRFWHSAEYYEPGGPIILMNAGEVNGAAYYGYVTNSTINGVLAQKYHGAAIVLEHRFFGLSNPIANLNTESLELLTVNQTIEDHVYFAQNVVLPNMDAGDQVKPNQAPWVLIGGSYPGALVSWTMAAYPDVFWIGYASSATVHSQVDFWQYFEPIRKNMPANCSADVQAVVTYLDEVSSSSDVTAQEALRSKFGMADYDNHYLAEALRWDLWEWQNIQPTAGYDGTTFWKFCDALEWKEEEGVAADPGGWGLEHAVNAWGTWFQGKYFKPLPAPYSNIASELFKPELKRADIPVDDSGRSWTWLTCTEVGLSLDGPPVGQGGIVSRQLTPWDDAEYCTSLFPERFPTAELPNVAALDAYSGWDVKNDRLFFANGINDPWLEATVSAVNSTAVSTDRQPIGLSNGFHATDLVMRLAAPDPTIVAVQNSFLEYAGVWLAEFKPY
ncbi:peptidase S28 [Cylindrobasidium torrendii FP15055 ss-10]|uniref:Peptidase S28 n=1 Tax=Cylindrobasidium torrendii FP15055 ss-10 TaxID=1314674 RepID=A0A0D7B0D2_9AGAR|nr:peptidase S28 [Cylindrobasidium torrendii FP15055 ss-10]